MNHPGRLHVAVLTMALLTGPVAGHAFTHLTSVQLAERCRAYLRDADSGQGRFCAGYIRGFIDGASTVVVFTKPPEAARRAETFTQRAARTRLGRPAGARPEYCIDGSLGMASIVEQVVSVADERPPPDDADATVLLHATFARYHKCAA